MAGLMAGTGSCWGLVPGRRLRQAVPGGDDALQRRMGVRAAACLAGEAFGCPGMGTYRFSIARSGVIAFAFDDALDAMGDLEGVGRMEWDTDGRFAELLSRFGGMRYG